MAIFELHDVSHRAGGRLILDRANWQVQPGEHWAILGANGAGKTTLLKIASGFLWPNAGGTVLRQGQRLVDLGQLRRSIGWVTLDVAAKIPPAETALETVVSGRFGQFGLRRRQLREQVPAKLLDEAHAQLAALGADGLASQDFGTLSQGERQKVLIARARMARPLVILLDEPCAGLDPGSRERLLASLETLAQQTRDVSLVLVTHHVEEIMPPFARTLAMADGCTVAAGRTDQLVTEDLLTRLYDAKLDRLIRRNGRAWAIW